MADFLSGATQGASAGSTFGPWGAAIGGVVGGISGLLGSSSAKKAAEEQKRRMQQALDISQNVYNQTRGDTQPYMTAGAQGANALTSGLRTGEFTNRFDAQSMFDDPGYQFRLDEGQRGLESSAAARGQLFSGATLKALQRYGQNYASNEYSKAYQRFTNDQDRAFNKNLGVAGMGQAAVGQAAGAGDNYASRAGSYLTGMGNAGAAGQIGSTNALVGGMQGAYNAYQNNELLRILQQRGGGGTAGGNISEPRAGYDDYRWGG